MKLTYEQIISAAVGIVRADITEKGIEFHRFSDTQVKAFDEPRDLYPDEFFIGYFGRNCRTTAGVVLDFYTNSKKVKLFVASNERPNESETQSFDVYIEKRLRYTFSADADFEFPLCGRKHRVRIYFPYMNFPVISGLELDDGATFAPTGEGVDVLCMGDSITHGASAANVSNSWVSRFSRAFDFRVLNQGNCGFVYDEAIVERVCDPKIVMLSYGTNDIGRKTLERFKEDTEKFLIKVKSTYPEAKIAAIIPIWTAWDDGKNEDRLAKRAFLREIYEKYGVFAVDGMKLVPNDPKYFADKVVHPNDEGFAYYASRLVAALEDFVK